MSDERQALYEDQIHDHHVAARFNINNWATTQGHQAPRWVVVMCQHLTNQVNAERHRNGLSPITLQKVIDQDRALIHNPDYVELFARALAEMERG